jgi:hypothetical protein
MNEEAFNLSMRQFLKHVGVHSQREIEKAVEHAVTAKTIAGSDAFPASMTLRIPGLNLEVKFDGEIRLE